MNRHGHSTLHTRATSTISSSAAILKSNPLSTAALPFGRVMALRASGTSSADRICASSRLRKSRCPSTYDQLSGATALWMMPSEWR